MSPFDVDEKLAKRIARGRREIERMDGCPRGHQHPPGQLGGYDNFYQNFRCALDALRCAASEHPPPKGKGQLDILAHALAMFEDLMHGLTELGDEQTSRFAAERRFQQEAKRRAGGDA